MVRTYFVFKNAGERPLACFYIDDEWEPKAAEDWAAELLAVFINEPLRGPASELAATVLTGVIVGQPDLVVGVCPVDEALYSESTVALIVTPGPEAPMGVRPVVTAGTGAEIHALVDPGFAALRKEYDKGE